MRSRLEYVNDSLEILVGRFSHILNVYSMQLVYFISFASTAGSLSVSEIFGWETFFLSFLQRLFMYPIILISGVAIFLNNRRVMLFSLPLAVLGFFTSFFHFFSIINRTLIGCGFALPCSTEARIVLFDYTVAPSHLPLMAFLSFFSIIFLLVFDENIREIMVKFMDV